MIGGIPQILEFSGIFSKVVKLACFFTMINDELVLVSAKHRSVDWTLLRRMRRRIRVIVFGKDGVAMELWGLPLA